MESISQIRDYYKSLSINEFQAFIEKYSDDERDGIRKLVETASKKVKALEAERERIEKMKEFEHRYEEMGYVCGIDEVGRGPLAGPVCAGAVILPKDTEILYLNDSKKLSLLLKGSMRSIYFRQIMKQWLRLLVSFRFVLISFYLMLFMYLSLNSTNRYP